MNNTSKLYVIDGIETDMTKWEVRKIQAYLLTIFLLLVAFWVGVIFAVVHFTRRYW